MAKNYSYKESKVTTKKLAGVYNGENHTINVDDVDKDVIEELKDFADCVIEIVVKEKTETDLAEE